MTNIVENIRNIEWFGVPKDTLGDINSIKDYISDEVEITEKADLWLLSATSILREPASNHDVEALEQIYQCTLPTDYKNFLLETNGAELFVYSRKQHPPICQCSLSSTAKLISMYPSLIQNLEEQEMDTAQPLYYIPIADVLNANAIGLSTNPEYNGEVFRLYADSGYIPYTSKTRGSHYRWIYGKSFTEWLHTVLDTYGAFGLGKTYAGTLLTQKDGNL